jgi:hypothetical protein
VGEPGRELADGQQLLAVALDALHGVADGLEGGQEAAQQRRVGEREAPQLLAVDLEEDRVDDRERRAAVARLGEQRHRPEEAARAVGEHQDLLAADLAGRLERPSRTTWNSVAGSPWRKRNSPAARRISRPAAASRSRSSAGRPSRTGASRRPTAAEASIGRP